MQPTGYIAKTDRGECTAKPDHSGPAKRDLQIAWADHLGKPNPPFQPAKKAEAERQRAGRYIIGRHAYDVSPSDGDVNSGPADQRNGEQRDQGFEERRIVRYKSLTYGPTQAAPEVTFVDHVQGYAPRKTQGSESFRPDQPEWKAGSPS
jgi:hypothetical protein